MLEFRERNWGFGPQQFVYDIPSISQVFYEQFAELDFTGFPCEPTLMFPECPQHAVLGMILADHLTGQHYGAETRRRYLEGFDRSGFVHPDTDSVRFAYRTVDKKWLGESMGLGPNAWSDGWTGLFMYAWAPDYVRELYPVQRDRHLPDLLDRRRTGLPPHMAESSAGIGYWLPYAAELGDEESVSTLLAFADEHFSPEWRDGRLYYPRNDDTTIDDAGVLRLSSAMQGNALIPFGRLNVADGLLRLHNAPWTKEQLDEPHVVGVDYQAAGVSEAIWSAASKTLTVSFLPGPLKLERSGFTVRGLENASAIHIRRDHSSQR